MTTTILCIKYRWRVKRYGVVIFYFLGEMFMSSVKTLKELIQKGKAQDVKDTVNKAVEDGEDIATLVNDGMIAAMTEVGDKFSKGEAYVPEMLIAARAMQAGMDILEPKMAEAGIKPIGKVIVGTVKGDLHDIGKNLVCMMLKGAGFEVVDLGVDVAAEKFVEEAKGSNCSLVACSALLTTTMPQMAEVVKSFKDQGVDAKVIIGGAPVTQKYCDEIGADGYGADANEAAKIAKSLLG